MQELTRKKSERSENYAQALGELGELYSSLELSKAVLEAF